MSLWSEAEISALHEMIEDGENDSVIAEALGRSMHSVRIKRYALGFRNSAGAHKAAGLCPIRRGPREDDLLAAFRAGFRGAELQAAAAMHANGISWG